MRNTKGLLFKDAAPPLFLSGALLKRLDKPRSYADVIAFVFIHYYGKTAQIRCLE